MADRGNRKDATPPPLLLMPPGDGLTMNASIGSNVLLPIVNTEASLMSPDDGEADSFVGQTPPMMRSPEEQTPKASQSSALGGLFSMFQSTPNTSFSSADADPFSQVKQPDPNQTPSRPPPSIGGPLAALSGPTFSPWQSNQSGSSTPERRPPQSQLSSPALGPPQPPAMMSYNTGQPMNSSFGAAPSSVGQFGAPLTSVGQVGATQSQTNMGSGLFGGPPPVGPPTQASGSANFHRIQGPPRYARPPPGTYANSASQSQLPPPMSQLPLSSSMSNAGSLPVAEVIPMVSSSAGSMNDPVMMSPLEASGAVVGSQKLYVPVQPHWYFCKIVEHRAMWFPMSLLDSVKLEDAFKKGGSSECVVATDGGRYDVSIGGRQRNSLYWEEAPSEVRRCTWFYKSEGDNRFIPYDEDFAVKLEEEYKVALLSNVWHKRLEFPGGETIVMHNPNVIVHFRPSSLPDEWGTTQQGDQMRPRVVKRGIEDTDTIDDGEPRRIDHVIFVCHGIGSICDLKLRSLVECVDNLRSNSLLLLRSHFKKPMDDGQIGRVEFLPVLWHAPLHGDATGVDRNLKRITLKSIPKLRHYTNDTLMDILFYTSPKYCQIIVDTVSGEMNRLYKLFLERTPDFRGKVSVAGHSLGSAILFDLLCHQNSANEEEEVPSEATLPDTLVVENDLIPELSAEPEVTEPDEEELLTIEALLEKLGLMNFLDTFKNEQIDLETLEMCGEADIKELGLPMGPRKKIQGFIRDHKEKKEQKNKAAELKVKQEAARLLAEETKKKLQEEQAEQEKVNGAGIQVRHPLIRGASKSEMNFLMGKAGTGQPFVNYPSLDFEPINFFALGSPIALFLSTRGLTEIGDDFRLPSATGVFNIFHPFDPIAYRIEPLIQADFSDIKPVLIPHHKGRKRLHLELKESLARVGADLKQKLIDSVKYTWNSINDFARAHRSTAQEVESEIDEVIQEVAATNVDHDKSDLGSITESVNTEEDLQIGQLNYGRRIDYVLQEKPIESFNDYLFALASHLCYWESEDTALLILKETYALLGVFPEQKGPQSTPQKIVPPPMYAPPQGPYGQQRPLGMVAPQGPSFASHGPPPMGGPPMGRPMAGLPMSGPPMSGPPMSGSPMSNPPMSGPPPLSGFVRK